MSELSRGEMYLQAKHTMTMIRELPRFAAHGSHDAPTPTVRVACLEAFFMDVRAITDFLCCRPEAKLSSSDFSARDWVADWQPVPVASAARLAKSWVIASTHVAHFSRARLQQDPDNREYYPTDLAALEAIAADAQLVWDSFAARLDEQV